MKKSLLIMSLFIAGWGYSQEEVKVEEKEKSTNEPKETTEPDTIRFKVGKSEVLVISRDNEGKNIRVEEIDTIDAAPPKKERHNEAHWGGMELGFNVNLNAAGTDKFSGYEYWENDPAKSIYFNFNIMEKKFKIIKEYVGLTTGMGFNFNSIGFKDNYVLVDSIGTIYGKHSAVEYSKNKLKASYFQVPLMLEFNTHANNNKGFYLAAGVIGGVRMSSKIKREGKLDGDEFTEKQKGTYALNAFKLDATARLGHGNWGGFVNYSLIPLFDTSKTVAVHPLTFGLSYGF